MKTKLKTAPTDKPISRKEAKEHCRIILGNTDEDDYIDSLIDVAVARVEQFTRRRLITQTWYYYLNDWPCSDRIPMPYGNLQTVSSVKYTDSDGDQSTWTSSYYISDTDTDPGSIVLAYGETWPTATLYPSNPIEIEFICGYGDDDTDVPEPIRQAIKLHVSDLYENRESVTLGTIVHKSNAIESLLWPYILRGVF